ncbi:hypothetical protein [Thermosyntropha lipolytica]|uniref:hypothetical protein n=1 Tax=Thermosyntropha lipolytica TaxID=54294 RepID=UPI0013563006|nr:hypothetical protein [Thermosyntropha lipolytica]
MPNTTVNNAVRLAEELRESLSQMDISGVGRGIAHFGVAGRNCVRYRNECE